MKPLSSETIESAICCYGMTAYSASLGHLCYSKPGPIKYHKIEATIKWKLQDINSFIYKNYRDHVRVREFDRTDFYVYGEQFFKQIEEEPGLAEFKPEVELLRACWQGYKEDYKYFVTNKVDPASPKITYFKSIKSACNHVLELHGLKAQAQAMLKKRTKEKSATPVINKSALNLQQRAPGLGEF